MSIVKQLLADGLYEEARSVLERQNPEGQEDLRILSLLYQHLWAYDQEAELVRRAHEQYPDWDYMQERVAWHARPLFHHDPAQSKLVPRKPLHLERDPALTPKQETLENLCIVTGADSGYFGLLVECLESLRATQWYKDVDICVVDCGLTEEEKHFLQKFQVKEIKDPGWDVEVAYYDGGQPLKNHHKALMVRPFLPKHFPNYEYYLWFDADMWVQEERGLDQFLLFAETYGCGFVVPTAQTGGAHTRPDFYRWTEEDRQRLSRTPSICSGVFCVTSKNFEIMARHFEKHAYRYNFTFVTDEASMMEVALELEIPQRVNCAYNAWYRNVFVKEDKTLLYLNENNQLVTNLHLYDIKHQHFYTVPQMLGTSQQHTTVPIRYRTWPYVSIEEICQTK